MNLLIVNSATGSGGIESHSITLTQGLIKRGHRAILACADDGDVRHNAVGCNLPTGKVRIMNACDLISIARLMGIASREKISIILANLGKEYWPATMAAKLLGKKIVLVRHQRDPVRKTTRWLMNNKVDMVIAVSSAVKDVLISSGISEKKIQVIHNAVSLSRFRPSPTLSDSARSELGILKSDLVIGTAGKLHAGKGIYEILRAAGGIAPEYPSLKILFVGDGAEREGITREARRLGIAERVIITGFRESRDMGRMYASMDIFALPSYNEGLPTVLVEAMAMNLPVIATPVGGVPEIIRDGENGLLIPPGDDKALLDSIARLMADREFAAHMAASGRQTVESEFSEETLAERFERMFLSLDTE